MKLCAPKPARTQSPKPLVPILTMTRQEQINNWLTSAFNATSTGISEFFYFDRRDNEFFSILAMDYFIVDDQFRIDDSNEISYSKKTLKLLSDRMKRIDQKDPNIISIPLADSNLQLQNQIDSFINLNAININTATIWETEDASITVNVGQDKAAVNRPWWKFW